MKTTKHRWPQNDGGSTPIENNDFEVAGTSEYPMLGSLRSAFFFVLRKTELRSLRYFCFSPCARRALFSSLLLPARV